MKLKTKLFPVFLAAILAIAPLAACSDRAAGSEDESSQISSEEASAEESEIEGTPVSTITPDYKEQITEKKALNDDTVGWLEVPNTTINDVVVQAADNKYYYRRNFEKQEDFYGTYYVDRRAVFGDGTREQLPANICIYGHSMTDIPTHENYGKKFAELHDFRTPEQAEEIPYIFFSTEQGNFAYEVFAVFVANTDNSKLPYNDGSVSQTDYVQIVRDEVLPRSKYNYDVEIKDDDKFICLSTCIYTLDNGRSTNYPNTYMRYIVMGRLVDENDPLKEKAVFSLNENVFIDPEGKVSSAGKEIVPVNEEEAAA